MKAVRSRVSYVMPLIAVCLLPLLTPCSVFGQAFVAYSASGSDAAAISPVVDAFRNVLGTVNNGNASETQPNGRREVSWDGGGDGALATTFSSPMIAFNTAPTTRGVVFTTSNQPPPPTPFNPFNPNIPPVTIAAGFEISGIPSPKFDDINTSYGGIFTTFSAPRLFTPLGTTITDVHFFVPGTSTPAVINAFGAVFTDVDFPQSTSIEYFDGRGSSLGRAFVPPANNGLSFVGVVFADKHIARVRITSGNMPLGPSDGLPVDVVVMDDFIYGEPTVEQTPPNPFSPPSSQPPPNSFNPPSNQPPPNPFNPTN